MNYRPFPRPKCPEGLCIFYSFPLPRVNVQTPYRFQSFLSQYVSSLDTKSPGAGQTPSVKPCGFATSLSEGGSGETGSFAPEPETLPMRKAPSLRGLSPQATGGVCPKRKKAPKGGLAATLRGERARNFLLSALDADGNTNVALLVVALDHNAYIRPVAVLLHTGINIGVDIFRDSSHYIT